MSSYSIVAGFVMPQSINSQVDAARVLPKLELVVSHSLGLSEPEQEHALSLMHRDSFYSQTVATLTTGIFLTGFALEFKAPNFIIGLLAAIPALAQLLQLPAIGLLKKYRSRQTICAWATMLSRLFLVPMTLTPFIPSAHLALTVLIFSYICHHGIGAVSLCAWNSLLKDVVPPDQLGLFSSRKHSLNAIVTIVLFLLGGYFIDGWSKQLPTAVTWGYSLLFALAILIGLLGIRPLKRIPGPIGCSHSERLAEISLLTMLKQPFRDTNFRKMLLFVGSWNFAINLAAPFFAVYMLTMLKYPMALVTALIIASQVANLMFVKTWGKLADRFSNKSVLSVAAPLFITCVLGWTFIPYTGNIKSTLPIAAITQILFGIASAGVNLAGGNIALKLAPQKKPDAFLAVHGMVASVAAGLAPVLGGLFADYFSHQELSLVLQWHSASGFLSFKTLDIQYWDFFFAFAFILGLISLTRLAGVQEPGEVRKKVIVRELVQATVRPLTKIYQRMSL